MITLQKRTTSVRIVSDDCGVAFLTGLVTGNDEGVMMMFPVTLRVASGPPGCRSRCCRLALMLSFGGMKLRVWPPWGAVSPLVSGGQGGLEIFLSSHLYAGFSLVQAVGAETREYIWNIKFCVWESVHEFIVFFIQLTLVSYCTIHQI